MTQCTRGTLKVVCEGTRDAVIDDKEVKVDYYVANRVCSMCERFVHRGGASSRCNRCMTICCSKKCANNCEIDHDVRFIETESQTVIDKRNAHTKTQRKEAAVLAHAAATQVRLRNPRNELVGERTARWLTDKLL